MRPHSSAPVSNLPIVYFMVAHACLAGACAALVVAPDLAGAFFFHPKMVALVHLLTLGWLTGSILGAFYLVAPLALRLPLPVRRADWWAAAGFVAGVLGVVSHAWMAEYDGLAWSAALVLWPVVRLAIRAAQGGRVAVAPWPVMLHVYLAFLNMIAAGGYGALLAWDKARGALEYSPLLMAYAHAHLAAVGWVLMMIVGLAYRLVPMFLPAAMPTGASLAWSGLLIEVGLLMIVAALPIGHAVLPWGAVMVTLGIVSFVWRIHGVLADRKPRPPALPARDWSMWQSHAALAWMVVATGCGLVLTFSEPSAATVRLAWFYGVAGLVGFLAQMVVGIQGRLVPLYLWYRAWDRQASGPPGVAANALPSAAWARAVFLLWTGGVPTLAWGLVGTSPTLIRSGAGLVGAGVLVGAVYLLVMMRRLT